jgi:hypothetical protein
MLAHSGWYTFEDEVLPPTVAVHIHQFAPLGQQAATRLTEVPIHFSSIADHVRSDQSQYTRGQKAAYNFYFFLCTTSASPNDIAHPARIIRQTLHNLPTQERVADVLLAQVIIVHFVQRMT